MSVKITDDAFENAARALVPFAYGAFEQHGTPEMPFIAGKPSPHCYNAVRAVLEAALAHTAEKAEPVAYAEKDGDEWVIYWPGEDGVYEHIRDYPDLHKGGGSIPLYTHPAPSSDLVVEVERLRKALETARECIAHWGAYASEYFQEKHDLKGDLAEIDAVLSKEGR